MNKNPDKSPLAEVGEANFQSEVLKSKQPVLVAFRASWSRPCQILDAALGEVAAVCAGSVKVVKVSADDNPDLSVWYDVQSIPTLLYFVNGTVRAKIVGTASKEAILSKLQGVLRGDSPALPPPVPAKKTSTTTREPSPAAPPARYSAKRNLHHANFFCRAPAARQVSLVGDFNQWNPLATPMRRMPDGRWMASLELPHGYHQYLFLVDGKPVLDPNASGKARNERNEPVSLIAVS